MPTAFTTDQLGSCSICGQLATHRIIGHPGNVPYGLVCKRHIRTRLAELNKAHQTPTKEFRGTAFDRATGDATP
jgi:hypothetical protein